jgi:hypothetical protein
LESLEIPGHVVRTFGLASRPKMEQMALLERPDAALVA